jgi:hypothetical protein
MDVLQFSVVAMEPRTVRGLNHDLIRATTKGGSVLMLHTQMAAEICAVFNSKQKAPAPAPIYSPTGIANNLHMIVHRAGLLPGDLEVIQAAYRLIMRDVVANAK